MRANDEFKKYFGLDFYNNLNIDNKYNHALLDYFNIFIIENLDINRLSKSIINHHRSDDFNNFDDKDIIYDFYNNNGDILDPTDHKIIFSNFIKKLYHVSGNKIFKIDELYDE
jgi:hypothetical protein